MLLNEDFNAVVPSHASATRPLLASRATTKKTKQAVKSKHSLSKRKRKHKQEQTPSMKNPPLTAHVVSPTDRLHLFYLFLKQDRRGSISSPASSRGETTFNSEPTCLVTALREGGVTKPDETPVNGVLALFLGKSRSSSDPPTESGVYCPLPTSADYPEAN